MKHPVIGTVKNNRWLTPNIFELMVAFPDHSMEIKPGQFVELQCQGNHPVYLNRPFSPFMIRRQDWYFLIQNKGKGTNNLSHLQPGDKITMLSPLGKPFLPPTADNKILLIAGGVGLAPIYYYISHYLPLYPKLSITLLHGTSFEEDKIELPGYLDVLQYYFHADQSASQTNSNLFQYYQTLPKIDFDTAFVCGPLPMMRAFSRYFTKENRIHFVSLEMMMACGLGFCKGCSISTSDGMKSVCSDGPVFDGSELDWNLL